jgi:hypothetical protein
MGISRVGSSGGVMQTKFSGNIETIRAVEDCIRATKKYTEGISTIRQHHPIQGEDFPSRVFGKYYEVYPKTEISWNMPVNTAVDWLWCDVPCINLTFHYDYRSNEAYVLVKNGDGVMSELMDNIPGIEEALKKTIEGEGKHQHSDVIMNTGRRPNHIHVQRTPK